MTDWLNSYQRMYSPTGKKVTVFTDNALWRTNPWKEIKEAGRRYRAGQNGGWEIQQFDDRGGEWIPVNSADLDYWTDYVNQIEKKAANVPTRNFFQHVGDLITNKPVEQKQGGRLMRIGGKIVEVPRD